MSEPTAIEKEAGKIVEGACASLEACPCGCNREATAGLFAEMPDEELLFDVADLFKAFSDTTRIKILFALMGGGLSVGDIAADEEALAAIVDAAQAVCTSYEKDCRIVR